MNCFSFCTEWVGLHCYVTTVNSLVETYWCSNFCQRGETLFSAYFFFFFFFLPLPVKKVSKSPCFLSSLAGGRVVPLYLPRSLTFIHLRSLHHFLLLHPHSHVCTFIIPKWKTHSVTVFYDCCLFVVRATSGSLGLCKSYRLEWKGCWRVFFFVIPIRSCLNYVYRMVQIMQ